MHLPSKIELTKYFQNFQQTGNGIEVGVCNGDLSAVIHANWTGNLFLLDAWRHFGNMRDATNTSDVEQKNSFLRVASHFYSSHRVFVLKATSKEGASIFQDGFFDWIYIDADHSYDGCLQDLRSWWGKLRKGGLFSGHDYVDGELESGSFGVISALKTFAEDGVSFKINTTQEPHWKSWFFTKE